MEVPLTTHFSPSKRHLTTVSVIVAVFNKERSLRPCLDSLLNQALHELEIICIDDASTDGCPSILAEYARIDQRIRVYRNIRNIGPGPSRNIGIKKARGTYVQFTDADDIVPSNGIRSLYELAARSHSVAVRGTFAVVADGYARNWFNHYCKSCMSPPDREQFDFSHEPALSIPWFHTCFLFSRAFLITYAIEFPDLRDGEDPVFVAFALTKARYVSATSEVVYLYRGDRRKERSTFVHKLDFLRHVSLIKSIFMPQFPRVWNEHCSQFYLRLVKEYLEESAMTPLVLANAMELISQTWSTQELMSVGICSDGRTSGHFSRRMKVMFSIVWTLGRCRGFGRRLWRRVVWSTPEMVSRISHTLGRGVALLTRLWRYSA